MAREQGYLHDGERGVPALWAVVQSQNQQNQQRFEWIERMLQEIQRVVTNVHVGGDGHQEIGGIKITHMETVVSYQGDKIKHQMTHLAMKRSLASREKAQLIEGAHTKITTFESKLSSHALKDISMSRAS